jgi:hypothetical protein
MNRSLDKIFIGLWFVLAIIFGLLLKSWGIAFAFLLFAAFFTAGNWACSSLNVSNVVLRWIARVVASCFFLVIIGGVLLMIERLYLVNGQSYPAWLAKRDLGTIDRAQLLQLYGTDCPGMGAEINMKSDNLAVIRCGGMTWLDGHTYIARMQGSDK